MMVFMATGYTVIDNLYADNYLKQASVIRERFVNSNIVYVPDNDSGKTINKGLNEAIKAIESISPPCTIKVPRFSKKLVSIGCSDLWDYFNHYSLDAVIRLLTK